MPANWQLQIGDWQCPSRFDSNRHDYMVRVSAESFFEKAENRSPRPGDRREKIEAGEASAGERLDEAQFHHQRLDPVVVYQTVGFWKCATTLSQSATRTDLHHLDRPRLVLDSNP